MNATLSPNHTPGIFPDGKLWKIDYVRVIHGKRVHIFRSGIETEEAAKDLLPHLVEEKVQAAKKAYASPTFDEFLVIYKAYRSNHVRPSTVLQVDSLTRCHMSEFFGRTIAETFNLNFVSKWYSKILANPTSSNQWKNKIISAVKRMFEQAWKWKYITPDTWTDLANIMETVQESKRKSPEKGIWTPRQLDRFLSVLPTGSDDEALFRLFCALGARISEFVGLTWECFDKRRGTIEIKQQVLYLKEGHWTLTEELKTSESYRVCRLDPTTLSILLDYQARKAPQDDAEFIFPSADTKRHRPTAKSTIRRKMREYIALARVPLITPHGIRHTKATMLMSVCKNMAEVKAAARYLGHSATMMIDTYGHAKEDSTSLIISRLDKR